MRFGECKKGDESRRWDTKSEDKDCRGHGMKRVVEDVQSSLRQIGLWPHSARRA